MLVTNFYDQNNFIKVKENYKEKNYELKLNKSYIFSKNNFKIKYE